jgi:hypothetical protein
MNYNNTDNLVIQETYDQLDRLYLKNYYLPAKRDTINGTVQRIPKKLIYQDLHDYKVGGNGVQTVDVKRVFIPELSKPKFTNSETAGCIIVSMSIIYKSKITLDTSLARGWGFMWRNNPYDLFNMLSQNDLSTNIIENVDSNNLISLIQGENSLQICGFPKGSNIWIRGYVQVETGRIWSPPAQFVV